MPEWRIPLKPTNSLELDWEPLSSGPNEGPRPRLGALPGLWSQEVSPRRPAREDRDLLPQPSKGHGASDDQMAPSQSPALLITQPMAGCDQKGGHPWAYSWRVLDESAELSLKSKTHATWTREGISIIFAQPRQSSTIHHTREEGPKRGIALSPAEAIPTKEGLVTRRSNLALRRHHAR